MKIDLNFKFKNEKKGTSLNMDYLFFVAIILMHNYL